jgi:heptosyltransferase-2
MNRLIVAPNWIGDAVLSLPVLRAIRHAHPGDRLAVIAPRGPAAIYRAEGSAGKVLPRSGIGAEVLALRRGRFDEAWLLPNSFRAALLPFLAGLPRRIGYATDRRGRLLTDALPAPLRTGHQLRDYDALLEARGIASDREPPRLPIPAAAAARAADALGRVDRASRRDLVLLCPGSAVDATKRWPAESYARLADALSERGLAVALAVGPGESALAARIAAAARSAPPAVGADLDPVELAGVLSSARAVVSNDSGPMHLAAAVGTPVVALFGPTDPGRTAPVGSRVRVLDRYLFCSPCFLERCPYGHECMREIGVETVLEAVEELL